MTSYQPDTTDSSSHGYVIMGEDQKTIPVEESSKNPTQYFSEAFQDLIVERIGEKWKGFFFKETKYQDAKNEESRLYKALGELVPEKYRRIIDDFDSVKNFRQIHEPEAYLKGFLDGLEFKKIIQSGTESDC